MGLRLYLALLFLIVGGLIGAAIVHYRLLPYRSVVQAKEVISDVVTNRAAYLGIAPVNHLKPAHHGGSGVTVLDRDRVAPGNTFFSGVREDAVALWLADPEGRIIREWRPPTSEILGNSDHIEGVDLPFNDLFVDIQGAALLPDGGVLFTISNYALVKMSACGEVDWTVPTMAHHSVFASDEGTYWAATRFYHENVNEAHPQYAPPFWEDAVIEVDADGNVLRTISMLDVIARNGLFGKLFGGDRDAPRLGGDFAHLNDVEVLPADLADAFPDFDPGDVMVSLRNPNLVIVFDPETLEAKWTKVGPWIRQHDPDFAEGGRIAVFDNRNDSADGKRLGGSRVVLIEPFGRADGLWEAVYEHSQETPFFTAKRGMLDLLPNGHILVAETDSGRAFEFGEDRKIVWEYVNRFDDTRVAPLLHAERYPVDHTGDAYAACD